MSKVISGKHQGDGVLYTFDSGHEFKVSNQIGWWTEPINEWLLTNTPEPEFTAEETAANAIAESYLNKWNQITAQIEALTVTVNGHKYAANKSAMTEINIKISSLDGTETISWYESWGSFQTNKLELQQVVIASCQAEQLIIDQVMGA